MYTFAQPLSRALGTPLVRSCGQAATGVELRVVDDAMADLPPGAGESVYAVVFSRRDVTQDELIAHCRARIAGFKVPRCIELRTEPLPKSAAGKILKRALREPHWAGQQSQISGG